MTIPIQLWMKIMYTQKLIMSLFLRKQVTWKSSFIKDKFPRKITTI